MRKRNLNRREKEFCMSYVLCGNIAEAALRAGYTDNPRKEGEKLLCRSDISDEIARVEKQLSKTVGCVVRTGYQRLAFGNIADAVSLLFMENPTREELERMDLFSVSEIKKPKEGMVEIKFFDRIKALERLEALSAGVKDEINPFYQALKAGADLISREEDENGY